MKKISLAAILSATMVIFIAVTTSLVAADLTIAPIKVSTYQKMDRTADPGVVAVGSEMPALAGIGSFGGSPLKMILQKQDQKSFSPQFTVTGEKVVVSKTIGEEDGRYLLYDGGDLFRSETGGFLGKAEPINTTFTVVSAIFNPAMMKGMAQQPGFAVGDPFGFGPA